MGKKIKKNRYRKVNPYIPVCILLLGAVVVAGCIGMGGEKDGIEKELPKNSEWERREHEMIELFPEEIEYEIELKIPRNVQIIELEDEIKLTWDGSKDAMAYDICIDDEVYEEVYSTEFIQSKPLEEEGHMYKVRARRYGSYTKWSETVFYNSQDE